MKFSLARTCLFAAATAFGSLYLPASSQAINYVYHVDINVASLVSAQTASGPFYLDVQLNGDGMPSAATNSISLSNFSFTLGSASGAATTYEGASGNFTSGVLLSLTSTNANNELYQGFTASTTGIHFDVSTTQNGSGITPDTFVVEILSGNLNPITTNAPDTISLLDQNINGAVTLAGVQTYRSTTPSGVTVSAIPEPTTTAAVAAGFGVLALLRRRKRN